mgnify:CR=1 FL=1
MDETVKERRKIVVIGAGASGLTVGNMLHGMGIDCVVLEHRSRSYVEQRQRAGVVELRAVRMFHKWGMGDVIVGPPYDGTIELWVDGVPRLLTEAREEEEPGLPMARFCPQQALVRNLLARLADGGGDVRFEASDVTIHDPLGDTPMVSYIDADGRRHEISCDYIAGCDGDHGVSRKAYAAGALTSYVEDYGRAWLSVLAEVPPPPRLVVAISDQGYACHIGRGPAASRFYLECPTTDTVEDWPDSRIWEQLRQRMGAPDLAVGTISEKQVITLRSSVHEPMRHGRLFLIGDAAHLIVPVSGKGMNLALRDAEMFVTAVGNKLENGDGSGLDEYSDRCLARVWNYQEFTLSLADAFHDAGDQSVAGPFRRKIARARVERLLTSPNAARLYGEMMRGID